MKELNALNFPDDWIVLFLFFQATETFVFILLFTKVHLHKFHTSWIMLSKKWHNESGHT